MTSLTCSQSFTWSCQRTSVSNSSGRSGASSLKAAALRWSVIEAVWPIRCARSRPSPILGTWGCQVAAGRSASGSRIGLQLLHAGELGGQHGVFVAVGAVLLGWAPGDLDRVPPAVWPLAVLDRVGDDDLAVVVHRGHSSPSPARASGCWPCSEA